MPDIDFRAEGGARRTEAGRSGGLGERRVLEELYSSVADYIARADHPDAGPSPAPPRARGAPPPVPPPARAPGELWDHEAANALMRLHEAAGETVPGAASAQGDPHAGEVAAPPAYSLLLSDERTGRSERAGGGDPASPPQPALGRLEARVGGLERRLGSALEVLATRADVEGLILIEAHVTELSQQVGAANRQLERLARIEAELARLGEAMATAHAEAREGLRPADVARLAHGIGEHLSRVSHPLTAAVGELRGMLEDLAQARYQDDRRQAGVFDDVREDLLCLGERIAAVEREIAGPAGTQWQLDKPAAEEAPKPLAAVDPEPLVQVYYHPARLMKPEDTPRAAASVPDALGADAGAAGREASGTVPFPLSLAAALQAHTAARQQQVADAAREAPARPAGASPAASDFMAEARAADSPATEHGAPGEPPSRARTRRRRAGGSGTRASLRPGLLVAVLAVLVMLGAGLASTGFVQDRVPGLQRLVPAATLERASDGLDGGRPGQRSAGTVTERAAGGATPGAAPAALADPAGEAQQPGDGASKRPWVGPLPPGMLVTGSLTPPRPAEQPGAASPGNGPPAPADRLETFSSRREIADPAAGPRLPPAAVGSLSLRHAAARGDPSAEFAVAVRLAEGQGVEQDARQAFFWFERAAARGFAAAQYRLANLYERGVGVDADAARARLWYARAAEQGNVRSMHNLAVLATRGDGMAPDFALAARWFTEAAEHGLRDSQFNLGIFHERGLGVRPDPVQAYKWFAIAARDGDAAARARRDKLTLELDPDKLARAQLLVGTWRAKPVDPIANEPRAAADLWKADEARRG